MSLSIFVIVLFPFVKPAWTGDRPPFSSISESSRLKINFSKILEIAGRTDIVRMAPTDGYAVFSLLSGTIVALDKYGGHFDLLSHELKVLVNFDVISPSLSLPLINSMPNKSYPSAFTPVPLIAALTSSSYNGSKFSTFLL